ncbi:hypothetical protein N9089_02390 [Crocinitomicaceae bacterium]|nr:hypothetical protein [Crocinitomicaceae bacterium]
MNHIWYLLKAAVLVMLVFVAANQLAFPLLRAAIADSKFRAVVAANAGSYIDSGQRVTLFIGNSRIMGGINPGSISDAGGVAYNLAYNGLYLDDLRLMLDAFMRSCDCQVEYVYANPDIFRVRPDGSHGVSELQRFLSGFDAPAMRAVQDRDAVFATAMRLFPLLHFNNEFFLRALYYSITGRDDQHHGSDYKITISREMELRLRDTPLDAELDSAALQELRTWLSGVGARLVVIEPPYHRAYLGNVPDFEVAQSEIKATVTGAGISYLDHSGLFYDRPGLFSDPLHLNREGQRQYSRYILEIMRAGDDL